MITSAQIPTLGGRYYLQKAARHNYLNEIKERKPRRRLRLALTVAILVTDIIFAVALVDPRWLSFAYSSALRWMSTAVLIAFLVLNFRGWRSAQDELLSVCFGIFCATAVTSTVLRNEDLSDGLQRAIALLAVYFLAFVLVRSIPPDVIIKSWTSALYWVSIASCGASALVLTRADAYNLGRFSGIFQTPNFLGSASAIAIVLSLVKIGSDRGALGWFSLLFLPISAYCLYACNSRTNTAAVIIVFLCLPFYFRAKRVTALVIVAFVLVVAGLVLNVGGSLIPVSLVQRQLKASDRAGIWLTQWYVFKSSPMIGYGLAGGSHTVDFESPLTNGRAGGEGSYGDLLTVAGLVGCIPLFLGLLVGVYRLGRLTFANRNCRWLGEAFFTVVLIMIVSIADGWLATVGTVMQYIWVIIGATAVLTSIRCRRS